MDYGIDQRASVSDKSFFFLLQSRFFKMHPSIEKVVMGNVRDESAKISNNLLQRQMLVKQFHNWLHIGPMQLGSTGSRARKVHFVFAYAHG